MLGDVFGCNQAFPALLLTLLITFKNISPTGQKVSVHFTGERSGSLTIPLWVSLKEFISDETNMFLQKLNRVP